MRSYKKKVAKKPPASFIINKQKQADENTNATNKSSNKYVLNKNPSKNQNDYKYEAKKIALKDCSTVKELPESLIKSKVKEAGVLKNPKTLNEQSKNKSSVVNSEDIAIKLPRTVEQPVRKNIIENSIKTYTVQNRLPSGNENPDGQLDTRRVEKIKESRIICESGSEPAKKSLKF